jgi:hypothetical protein
LTRSLRCATTNAAIRQRPYAPNGGMFNWRSTATRACPAHILDLFGEDSWRRVDGGELEVRPPGAPTTKSDPTEKAAAEGIASGLLRRSANQLAWIFGTLQDREDVTAEPSVPKVAYTAMLLGATGNVGGRILRLLVQSPRCQTVVVVTRRNVAELANPKSEELTFDFLGLYRPGMILGNANTPSALVPRARAGQGPRDAGGEDSRVQGDGAVLRGGRPRHAVSRRMRQKRRTRSRSADDSMVYAENQIPRQIDSHRLASDFQTAAGRQPQASLARDEHG